MPLTDAAWWATAGPLLPPHVVAALEAEYPDVAVRRAVLREALQVELQELPSANFDTSLAQLRAREVCP
jgi:hypothetical protein